LNIPNIDTLSLIPHIWKEHISFPLKPLGANEIKLPESDDFMEFKSRLTTSASLNIGSANVMLLEISPVYSYQKQQPNQFLPVNCDKSDITDIAIIKQIIWLINNYLVK
jgi:hypothetical protein